MMASFSAEEILLENVELILEAFDYLQLPFALKTGTICKPHSDCVGQMPSPVLLLFCPCLHESMCRCKF
jgi:hypothetical protein